MLLQPRNVSRLQLKENEYSTIKKGTAHLKPNETGVCRKVLSEVTNLQTKISLQNNLKKKIIKNEEKVPNIDKLYEGNVWLVSEYANDIYKYLRKLEMKYTIGKWPFLNSNITDKMRTILVDWLVDVQVEYQLLQETLHTAISILDRYLEKDDKVSKDNVQLVGVTALYIACKYEELFFLMLDDFVYLCDKSYSKIDFLNMEVKILKALNFDLGRPVSITFLRRYNMVIQADRLQHLYSKYIIDLALLDCKLCHEKPSKIAAAATYIAICLIKIKVDSNFWTNALVYYSTYTYIEIKDLVKHLASSVIRSLTTNHDSVRRKYSSKSHSNISSKLFTSLDIIRELEAV